MIFPLHPQNSNKNYQKHQLPCLVPDPSHSFAPTLLCILTSPQSFLMKLQTFLSLLSLGSLCAAAPAPAPVAAAPQVDDLDKRGVQVVKVYKTIDNTITSTNVVEGTMSTITNTQIATVTVTTTRYTSTYTVTIFGNPYTYISVLESALTVPATTTSSTSTPSTSSTSSTSSSTSTTSSSSTSTTSVISNSKAATPATISSSVPQATSTTQATTSVVQNTSTTSTTSSSITQAPTTPLSSQKVTTETADNEDDDEDDYEGSLSGSWILEGSLTLIVSGVCYVDYDYYLTDYTETVTSTSTLYSTITV